MVIDINAEAYESSSELFSFKDMRRGVIEHGRVCYIEGYKKHSELFSTFLVKNGYFSDEELHKVIAEFDAYLNETPAISIRTCEDILKKLKIFNYYSKNFAYATELNSIQKDIVMHYCETLTDNKKILRIKKSRQNGISTILSIIAYLEAQNGKRVLYIGCSDPRIILGQKFNQFFTYKHSLTVKGVLGTRFELIIVDDPNTDNLECLKTLVTCIGENGKMIVALTPRGPKKYGYNEIKDFFKNDSGDMFTYSTGPCRRAEEILELSPDDKNEIMGDFID